MFKKIAPYLVYGFYKTLVNSWRIEVIESPEVQKMVSNNENFMIAHWHGDELGILHLLRKYHVAVVTSTSKDGDLMNKAVQLLGAESARGSSTRGGSQALKGLLRLSKKGRRPSLAVDGPKGPLHKVKPGVFQMSRLAQLPIVPISFYASSTYVFKKSWNKAELPKPFSKVTILWGKPLPPVSKDEDVKNHDLAQTLETAINQVKDGARRIGLKK